MDGTLVYDLHSHSTCSDGLLRPAELVKRAAQHGVAALALTDHDVVSGLDEARSEAAVVGIELIDGVEVSVSWNEHTLHIVGLGIDAADDVLVEGLRVNRAGRNARAERIAAALERIGIPGTLEGAQRYVTNPELVSRTHFARYLVESGRAKNTQAVFDNWLGEGKPGYVPHAWATLADAVHWIDAAGGIAVIAHPGRYNVDDAQRNELL